MAEEIINRVANNTKLITIDLEDYYPEGDRFLFDIKDWLFEGFILKEKDFRESVSNHEWSQYQNKYVALHCSTDAIIPGWAYLLLTTRLIPFAKKVVVGSLENLETILFTHIINELDVSEYQDKLLIIKGCSNKPVPESAYIELIQKLQPVAKSIMYGEACSSVPLFKRK
ncbi:DUF2480 family protein [Aquimarina sp. AD1]|uniref:DUF2480 family protein n=1 Tax=Aquimarina sp. (strain AD1) TaxID=1714848 RepID=UPI000E516BD3|nr:DUF2480 family protein [Aquimarina sp. AD1]AXT57272.1 DUF2480 family protein [Aquimarina sp. AD1]RKN18289.1 DUF2480 family protein [Aquimarina sp. AD1]